MPKLLILIIFLDREIEREREINMMMLKPYQVGSSNTSQTLFHYLLRKPSANSFRIFLSRPNSLPERHNSGRIRFNAPGTIKAVASSASSSTQFNEESNSSDSSEADKVETLTVKAVVTVQPTVTGFFQNLGIDRGLDDIQDLLGKSLLLELVSAELDPSELQSLVN